MLRLTQTNQELKLLAHSHSKTDVGVSSAKGAGNTNIGFWNSTD
jgi:hypothetical protein